MFRNEKTSFENNAVYWLIDRHIPTRSDRTAMIDDTSSITYGKLSNLVVYYSLFLVSKDLIQGNKMTMIADDSIDSIALLLAGMRNGLIMCPLNPRLSNQKIIDCIDTFDPNLIVAEDQYFDNLSKDNKLNLMTRFPALSSEPKHGPIHCEPVTQTTPSLCLFTSGTTGKPSAVLHRHKDILLTNQNYMTKVLAINSNDIIFSPSKSFFAYGFNSIHSALFNGATCILSSLGKKPLEIISTIKKFRATVFFSVPTIYNMMIEKGFNNQDLESLRLCISAGENLPKTLYRKWFTSTKKPIIDGIGTTELMSTVISNRPSNILPGSTGKIVPGFEAEIRDSSGKSVAIGGIGNLWIKGQTYPDSYLNNHSASIKRFKDGWFNTNDLFSRNSAGYFFYVGRVNEVIKVGGQWISPIQIEDKIAELPFVREVGVVGIKTENSLLRPKAFIVLEADCKSKYLDLIIKIKNHCKKNLSSSEYPHFIEFIPNLPRTATGKLQRFALSKKFGGEQK
ncbi:MAG: AMP-binding protein [Pseudobacteriovorax sp.]|nr:AMP-binding protein [Pseudobacteriovorax sp.]